MKVEDNEINSIDNFKCLSQLKELKKINVKGNPFCKEDPNFKDKLFQMLSTLESVDSHNKEGGDVESSVYVGDEEGEEEDDDEKVGDEEEEEFDEDEDDEGEEFNDDDIGEDDEDDEDDDDEEDEKPKKKSKK